MDDLGVTMARLPILLSPAGADSWRALDPAYPPTDARCLLAYVESIADHYLVLSLIPPLGTTFEVDTLSAGEAVIRTLHDAHYPGLQRSGLPPYFPCLTSGEREGMGLRITLTAVGSR